MRRSLVLGSVLASLGLQAACSEKPAACWCIDDPSPGALLPEGGEALLEVVHLSGGLTGGDPAVVNWFHAYQYGGAFMGATKFPSPGECTPIEYPTMFPYHELDSSAAYVDLGDRIELSGPGLGSGLEATKFVASEDGMRDNRPSPQNRHPEGAIVYGGPQWQNENFQDYLLEPGGEYVLVLGLSDQQTTLGMPQVTQLPLGIGESDIEMPATGDLDLSWEPPTEEYWGDPMSSAAFIVLLEFPNELTTGPIPRFLCQPPIDPETELVQSSLAIPESVIAQMPDSGIIEFVRYTSRSDMLEDNDGNSRRFDLYGTWVGISIYDKK